MSLGYTTNISQGKLSAGLPSQAESQDEKITVDVPSTTSFVNKFAEILKDGKYDLDVLYNAGEAGLFLKILSSKTLESKREH